MQTGLIPKKSITTNIVGGEKYIVRLASPGISGTTLFMEMQRLGT